MEGILFWLIVILGINYAINRKKNRNTNTPEKEAQRKRERDSQNTSENWHSHYDEQAKKREQEIAEDKYYNLSWEDKKLAQEIHVSRTEPTFEEWKAAREQGSTADQEQPEKPSTYRFVGSQLPKDDTIIYKQTVQQPTYQAPPRPEPKPTPKPEPKPEPKPVQKPTPTAQTAAYQNAYEAVNILTRNESENYKKLKIAADRKGYIICPKVRLADIVKPRNDPQYMSRFGKIKSKHVDFVIYDGDMRHLKAVIELDDSSHNRPDRKERDEFVDFILNDCGIRTIHTRYITPDILDNV